MPSSAKRVWKQLGQNGRLEDERIDDGLKSRRLAAGTYVGKPEPIFLRLDKAATLQKLEALAETDRNRDQPKEALKSVQTESGKTPDAAPAPASESPTPSPQPLAPSPEKISIEDFAKVDMRVGQVVAAERVPGAHKLLKLNVDIGAEVRQVVAGIAEAYAPEQLVGMKVVIVTNLQPRKLRGVESNGMIVAASVDPGGKPVLVTFKEEVPNGARLK
jgi:methionyl-tRNA synthetase